MLLLSIATEGIAQSTVAPASGNAMAASRDASVPVNLYSGIPSISIPLFSYQSSSGLATGISLDYFAGGVKVNEAPSSVGLGWNLNMGGVITRTVKGIADDMPWYGYMYSPALSTDSRSKTFRYYMGCEDSEPDIFQFNFNGRSGSFMIGKNKEVLVGQMSKIKIEIAGAVPEPDAIPLDSMTTTVQSFSIVTEDGTKYFFDNIEYQKGNYFICGMGTTVTPQDLKYATAWYLSKIIAPFTTDTIKLAYAQKNHVGWENWIQADTIRNGVHHHSDTGQYSISSTAIINKVPTEISFPDSTKITLVYSQPGQFRFTSYPVLQRIKFGDSVFRYGYMLNWDTSAVGGLKKDFLTGLQYYTANTIMPGYNFTYHSPYFPLKSYGDIWTFQDTSFFLNRTDHWGFYNGVNNRKEHVPTVPGLFTGANRTPNALAMASSLASVKDPSGGVTYYQFENNEVLPTVHTKQSVALDISSNTQATISLSRVQSPFCNFTVVFNPAYARTGVAPISGPGNIVFTITSLNSAITYASATLNLYEMYYAGSASFSGVVPNGSVLLKATLGSGTTTSYNLPVNVYWNNQTAGGGNGFTAGGLRIKQIRHFDSLLNKMDTLVTYKYVMADGKSSGFGGPVPDYTYDFYNSMSGSVDKVIISNPTDIFSYAEANPVAYRRVEVIKGSLFKNLGKVVHEFSGPDEGAADTDPASFPFMPIRNRFWACGLPQRTLTYDSSGKLIQLTRNSFSTDSISDVGNNNFASLKFERHTNAGTPSSNQNFVGQWSYPLRGNANLVSSVDTFFHPDNSQSLAFKQMEYDTNFNIKKITTDYDKTRGLVLEKRMYYAYDYTLDGAIGALRDSGIFAPIASESWITGDGNPRMIAAEISNYSKIGLDLETRNSRIKLSTQYSFQANKPVAENVIGIFNPAVLIRDSNYLVAQQHFAYDRYGNNIQVSNPITAVSNAVIFDNLTKHTVARIANARAADVAHASFENQESGNWVIPPYTADSSSSLTGKYSFPLQPYNISKTGLSPTKTYTLSYWAKNGSAVYVNAGTSLLIDQQNGWNFYVLHFSNTSEVQISGSGFLDELRLHPKDASMTSTTFNTLGKVTSTCDANNTVTYYEYDEVNRIRLLRDKDLKVLKKYEYPANITTINTVANWMLDSSVAYDYRRCELDANGNTGRVLLKETDQNFYSETYKSYRHIIVEKTDYVRCPVPQVSCGSNPQIKSVNGVCETGCRINTSSVYRKIYDAQTDTFVFRWECTYHYAWSDSSISPNYTDLNLSSCPLRTLCFEEL